MPQVWSAAGWAARFGLPAGMTDHGYGHTPEQVAAVAAATASADLLTEYHEQTYAQSVKLVSEVTDESRPGGRYPVDAACHARRAAGLRARRRHAARGQAAYVRGLLLHQG